ncbi:unnamed protein product [Ranitomeya imitator]|uniref:Helix-turn-helix domain-containing protein n=1 Tax=Ranitomeya imitator TaxID=111125 RepID=A0ABN9LMY5_9NEOB|nr:unnamed protein product [Ranitomeya imitator]
MILFALAAAAWHWLLQDIVPVYQIKGISKLVKLCLPKVQCFCDSLTSPPSERQDTFYLQKWGTAMGSNVAPPYANTYMAEFETSIIYGHPLFIQNVSVWKRFIDDIFCIWDGTLESLQEFFLFLNGAWPGIKFTISHDLHSINFLDTMVIKDPTGVLTTDLFSKSTDRNSLLHYRSFHPPSTKRSIPISQFQRVKRIVPDKDLCDERLQNMTTKFLERGYPPTVLAQSRDPPPRSPVRDQGKRIPFVHSYHPFSSILHKAPSVNSTSRYSRIQDTIPAML